MLLGYASKQIQKVCEEERAARKHLPQEVAGLLPLRLSQLAAFRCLKDVPSGAPFVFHSLRENWSGHYAVRIDVRYRIVFKPLGESDRLPDGTPDLGTVSQVEIVAVENYHKKK